MKNGITYYRLKSPYEGDYLKNCGLEGSEIDNNFFVLEGRDVKSIDVIGDDIVLTLINGDTISAEDALKGYTKDLSFSFDEENGVLIITHDGEVTEISGFTAECCPVATDNTLVGDGTKENPLGIASGQQTGHYKPVIGIKDFTNGEKLPDGDDVHLGDRYIVKDSVNDEGLLYDYHGVMSICCKLKESNSEWRIPTIDDWNAMLNSIEPDDAYKTHSTSNTALWQGKYAGKFLKSSDIQESEDDSCGWVKCDNDPCSGCEDDCNCDDDGEGSTNPCVTHDCGHEHMNGTQPTEQPKSGIDCYGFSVEPIGYAVSADDKIMYGKRSYFWTGSKSPNRDVAYAVGFDACKTTVQKDIMPFDYFMSLRLVKDYNGRNFYGQENINDMAFDTVLIPGSNTIWTRSNVAFPVCDCHSTDPKLPDGCSGDLTVYYIAEWNGTSWVYTIVNVGYTVVVLENGIPTEYIVTVNSETGKAELVKKDFGSEEIEIDIDKLKSDLSELTDIVSELDGIIGDYASDKGTIAERLDAIEEKIAEMAKNHDFGDIDNDGEWEPGSDEEIGEDSIIVNGKPW